MSDAISAGVTPDAFMFEFMKPVIAPARSLVPADGDIMPPPIIPPIGIEIWPAPPLPFITPSAASFISSVTIAEEELRPCDWAYFDIAASVMP